MQFLNANTGYVAGGNGTGTGRILKTTNSGLNWFTASIFSLLFTDLFFVDTNTGWVCDAASGFGGLYRTTNGGTNWQQQLGASFTPSRLFFLNQDTGWAVCNSNKLFRTTNSGSNWGEIHSFTSSLVDVFFVGKDTGWVSGGGGNGLMRTTNGGFNWDSVNNPGGIANLFFINNKVGWAGSAFNKMLATKDGYNWGIQTTPSFTNYSVQFVDSLKGWAGTSILIHTTDGGGPITYIGIKSSSTFVTSFDLKQNYPNPFNPSTSIDFEVQKPSRISLKIFSIDGREVEELLDYEKFSAGYHYVDFNAGDLSSGVYLYQMTGWTEDKNEIFIDTKKMVLLK
jgi:photosystem II stability/assembly factor-like uncharacterized protein